jgi:electron transport complex protein RnfG
MTAYMNKKQILISGAFLWVFAVVGTSFVAVTEDTTRTRIEDNERLVLLRNLNALLPAEQLDNDIVSDTTTVPASALLGTENDTIVYRARLQGKSIAAIFNSIAPNGYSGKIHLLVGVYADGSLAGVRAVKHSETPGLGDAIETQKTDWIFGFNSRSLESPAPSKWLVKKDGGDFDQFTGATITPRAVVLAVKNTLLYYQKNANGIFK